MTFWHWFVAIYLAAMTTTAALRTFMGQPTPSHVVFFYGLGLGGALVAAGFFG